jgi:hypothetical protein
MDHSFKNTGMEVATLLYLMKVFYIAVVHDGCVFSGEGSSGSEDENSEDDSDSRDHAYRCQHCFATSKLLTLKFLIS